MDSSVFAGVATVKISKILSIKPFRACMTGTRAPLTVLEFEPDEIMVEAGSPFRFGFLRARAKRLTSRGSLYRTLFEAFLEAPEGCKTLGGDRLWKQENDEYVDYGDNSFSSPGQDGYSHSPMTASSATLTAQMNL